MINNKLFIYIPPLAEQALITKNKMTHVKKEKNKKKTFPVRPFANINTPRGNHSGYLNTQTRIIASAARRNAIWRQAHGPSCSADHSGSRRSRTWKEGAALRGTDPTASTTEERNPRTKESPERLATVWTRAGFPSADKLSMFRTRSKLPRLHGSIPPH